VLLLGLALRVGIAMRNIDVVDRYFIPDDTYYTLAIARSIAQGSGPTADGVTATSGFQPLLAFLEVPLFWLASESDLPLRGALLMLACCDVAVAFFLAILARRLAGDGAALVAATAWVVSPIAIANALGGLETTLALALGLAAIEMWCRARRTGRSRGFATAGLLCGLCLLARIDMVFLVGALGLLELLRGNVRHTVVAAMVASAVVAPWWIYCTVVFGSPIPESGSAVIEVINGHRELYLDPPHQMGWAAGTAIGAPFVDLRLVRDRLFERPILSVGLWCLVLGVTAVAVRRLLVHADDKGPILALGIFGMTTFGFYTFVVPALWFYRRYMIGMEALVALLISLVVWKAMRSAHHHPVRASAAVSVLILATAAAVVDSGRYLLVDPGGTIEYGLHGVKGYREPAQQVLHALPEGAVVAALQSGALSYYAPSSIQVVNLDGVVNHDAARAWRERSLTDYARRRGATHFADFEFNLDQLRRRSEHSATPWPSTQSIYLARRQGMDFFVVLAVRWTG
jgi:hypothetical protein